MKRSSAIALATGLLAGSSLGLFVRNKYSRREELRITTQTGVDLEEFVYIGGIEQYLCHRGRDRSNPVLLFLHGGPGSPEIPFLHRFQLPWEARLTVVHWDQRGAGKTYLRAPDGQGDMTMERLLEDLDEVVSYLKRKYQKETIIILGHSWGTVLGTCYIKRYPKSIQAYIGVGQVVSMEENERMGYEKVLEVVRAAGNETDEGELMAMTPYPGTFENFIKKVYQLRKIQTKYGLAEGITLKNASTVLSSPFYSLRDATYFLRPAAVRLQNSLMEELYSFNLNALGETYQVPFFLIHGEEDWQTPYPLARDYFEMVQAPEKEFFSIAQSGHFTMADQTRAFTQALFVILEKLGEDG